MYEWAVVRLSEEGEVLERRGPMTKAEALQWMRVWIKFTKEKGLEVDEFTVAWRKVTDWQVESARDYNLA